MTPERYNLVTIKVAHVELSQLCNCCTQVDRFVASDFFMVYVSNSEVTIVKGVVNEARHALCANRVLNSVQGLQVGLFEDALEELAVNKVVHSFEHCDA